MPIEQFLLNLKDTWIDPIILVLLAIYLSLTILKIVREGLRQMEADAEGGIPQGSSRLAVFWAAVKDYGGGMLASMVLVSLGMIFITQLEEIVAWVTDIWEDIRGQAVLRMVFLNGSASVGIVLLHWRPRVRFRVRKFLRNFRGG